MMYHHSMVLIVTVIVFGFTVPLMLSKGGNMDLMSKSDTVNAADLMAGDTIMDGNGTLVEVLNVLDCDDYITVITETDEVDYDPYDRVDLYTY